MKKPKQIDDAGNARACRARAAALRDTSGCGYSTLVAEQLAIAAAIWEALAADYEASCAVST